jgi:hypothetical protein
MDDRTKIILAIVAIFLLGIPLLGRMVYEEPAPTPSVVAAAETPTAQGLLMRQTQLNGTTLADTVWDFDGTTIRLHPGRRATVYAPDSPIPLDGRWAFRGTELVITAGTRRFDAQVVDNQITMNGAPVERIQ